MKAGRRRSAPASSALPPPPPMQAPTLAAWHVPTRQIRRDRWPALVVLLILFGLFPVLDDDREPIDWLVAFGLAIAIWLLTGRAQKRKGVWIGKNWLCASGAWGYNWLRTDHLTTFTWPGGYFSMRDRDGRKLVVDPDLLRENPEVFRLFVSAVRHSIANGLVIDDLLRDELGVHSDVDR